VPVCLNQAYASLNFPSGRNGILPPNNPNLTTTATRIILLESEMLQVSKPQVGVQVIRSQVQVLESIYQVQSKYLL